MPFPYGVDAFTLVGTDTNVAKVAAIVERCVQPLFNRIEELERQVAELRGLNGGGR